MYCAWYGFGRAFIELLRTDSLMLGTFRVSSLLSFILCVGAVAALIIINKKQKAINADKTYIKLFENNEEIEND